jgi:hypothetical protein
MSGFVLIAIGMLGFASPAQAQEAIPDLYGVDDYLGGAFQGLPADGGIGFESSQPISAGRFIMDQYGMLHRVPGIQPEPAPRVERARRSPIRAGSSRARFARPVAGPRYQLPTGSLYWPGADGVMYYSPLLRYQSYGDGYGRGPYGSVDHGIMYKGWSLQN